MVGSRSRETRRMARSVYADDGGACAAPVPKQYLDFIGAADDMIVGQDVALAADDDAGAETGLYFLFSAGQALAEEMLEDGVIQQGMDTPGNNLGGLNVDHGRHCPSDRIGIGYRSAEPTAYRRCRRSFLHLDDIAGAAQQVGLHDQNIQERQRQPGGDGLQEKGQGIANCHGCYNLLLNRNRRADTLQQRRVCCGFSLKRNIAH
jgi:hypothetical protein